MKQSDAGGKKEETRKKQQEARESIGDGKKPQVVKIKENQECDILNYFNQLTML